MKFQIMFRFCSQSFTNNLNLQEKNGLPPAEVRTRKKLGFWMDLDGKPKTQTRTSKNQS